MIARTLLLIKHRMPWLWGLIERLNVPLYCLLHRQRMAGQAEQVFARYGLDGFEFRPLDVSDLDKLQDLIERQEPERLRHFQPHGFDDATLNRMYANPAFLMFGVFSGGCLVGYFFLRCFWNRCCFVGRLIDEPFEGQGIGRVMNQIMYHTAWWSGFRCMTTVSKHNKAIMRSHERNPHARVRHALPNDYLLIEFHDDTGSNSGLDD